MMEKGGVEADQEGGQQHSQSGPAPCADDHDDASLNMQSLKSSSRRKEATSYNMNEYEDEDEEEDDEKPTRYEVWGWYIYEFCSYFVQTMLIPVVFPLIIGQLQQLPTDPLQDWLTTHQPMLCPQKQIVLYSKLTRRTISVGGSNLTSLEWTSIAWGGGLLLSLPILAFISFHLDAGHFHSLATAAATGVGVFFCLPAGFFKTTIIFIPYISAITLAATVATASHTHYLSLMLRPFQADPLKTRRSQLFTTTRLGVSSWLSIYATAFGSLGAAVVSSLTYHMLREPTDRDLLSLWVVSIFCGLIWLVGVLHVVLASPGRATAANSVSVPSWWAHPFSVFRYLHAVGGLFGVFLSSFATMSVFVGGVLFVVGQLCIRPIHLLYLWLVYFIFPLLSLPLIQPLQHLMKVNSVKMQILGFLFTLFCSGFGFYFWESRWRWGHLLVFGAVQGTAAGVLHAFGRVLVMNCAPRGKEGAFSAWYGWVRSAGLCVGFAVGSGAPGKIRTSLGAAFLVAMVGIVVLLFGNVSDVGGAAAAAAAAAPGGGHDISDDAIERGSRSHVAVGLDSKEESLGV